MNVIPRFVRNLAAGALAKAASWGASPWDGGRFTLMNLWPTVRRPDVPSMREALAHHLVFRCMSKIADAACDVMPIVERRTREGWRAEKHPLVNQLYSPNTEQTWPDFVTSIMVDQHTYGRYYVQVLRSRSKGVAGFLPVDVRAVTEIGEGGRRETGLFDWTFFPEPLGRVVAYDVNDTFNMRQVKPEDMIAVYLFDRRGPLHGMSATIAALNSVGLLNSMNRYSRTYLKNGGPSGLLTIKGRKLRDETEADMIRAKWANRYYNGGTQQGQIAVVDDDAEFKPFGGHIRDIVNEVLLFSEEAGICSSFGVPPILAGAYVGLRWNSQRAGAESAQRDFWVNKMSPTMAQLRVTLTQRFLLQYEDAARLEDTIRVGYDLTRVEALREDLDKTANRTRLDYTANIITQNEARAARQLPPVPGGDVFRDGASNTDLQAGRDARARAYIYLGEPRRFQNGSTRPLLPAAKTFLWEGLELSRQPTELEQKMLRAVLAAQNSARDVIEPLMMRARVELITAAARALQQMSEDFQSLSIEVPPPIQNEIGQALLAAFEAGAATVLDELNLRSQKILSAIVSASVERILSAAMMALANTVAARFVSALLRRLMRDEPREQAAAEAEAEIREESTNFVSEIATGAALQAVGDGRFETIQANALPGDRFVYSAILDTNTCSVCRADDLRESFNLGDLPFAPNPNCEGRWRCRCMIVIAHSTEAQ